MSDRVERIWFDRDLVEAEGGRQGWRYTFDGGDSYIGHRDFLAYLRASGVRPKDVEWFDAGGMNIAGVEYAEIGGEDDEDEEEVG